MTYPAPSPPYCGPGKDSGDGNTPVSRIVMHGTVSPCVHGGARATAAFFRSPGAEGSAHYVVDCDEVVQVVWDSKIAWHAPPNQHSLGIELCDPVGDSSNRPLPMSRWNEGSHIQMLYLAADLVASLCLAYDVPAVLVGPKQLLAGAKGICEHSDVSAAWHQSDHWDLGNFPRQRFLHLVQAAIAKKTGDTAAAAKHAKAAHTRVTQARDLLSAALRHTKLRVRRRRLTRSLSTLPPH